MRQLIVICFFLTWSQLKCQVTDTIVRAYFHKMLDTVITIDRVNDYKLNDKFSLTKIYYDSIGVYPYEWKTIFIERAGNLDIIADSLMQHNYRLGLNVSRKGVNKIELKGSNKRIKDHWGYKEEYTVIDKRIYNGDTIYSTTGKHKFHFEQKESKSIALKKYYIPKTFIWTSVDSRMTYFQFIIICSEFDEEGNEIVTSRWASDMRK